VFNAFIKKSIVDVVNEICLTMHAHVQICSTVTMKNLLK